MNEPVIASKEENKVLAYLEVKQKVYKNAPKVTKFHATCTDDYCAYYNRKNDDRCKVREARKYYMSKGNIAMEQYLARKETKADAVERFNNGQVLSE